MARAYTEHQANEGRRAGGTEGRNTRCPPTPRMVPLHRQPGLEERKRRRIRSTFGHRKRDLSLTSTWPGALSHRRAPHGAKQGPAIGCGWFISTEHQDEGRRAGGAKGRNTRCPPAPHMAPLYQQPGLEERKRRRICSTFGHCKRDLSLASIWPGAPSHRRAPHGAKQGPAIGCGWFCSTEHQDEGRRAGGAKGRNTRCPPAPHMAPLYQQPGLEERKRRRICSTFGHCKRDLSLASIWPGAPSHRRAPHGSEQGPAIDAAGSAPRYGKKQPCYPVFLLAYPMSEVFYAVTEPRAASGEAYPMPEAFYWLLLWGFKKGSISHCLMAQPKTTASEVSE